MSNEKTITEFNNTTLRQLRVDLNELLVAFGNEKGIDINVGNISYSGSEATLKVKAVVEGGETREQSALKMTEYELGQAVHVSGLGRCTIEGYSPRRRKYPYLVKNEAGKIYKTSNSSIIA